MLVFYTTFFTKSERIIMNFFELLVLFRPIWLNFYKKRQEQDSVLRGLSVILQNMKALTIIPPTSR